MITAIGKLLFSLFAMHFALDYPFQGDTTAVQKITPLLNHSLEVCTLVLLDDGTCNDAWRRGTSPHRIVDVSSGGNSVTFRHRCRQVPK